MKIYTKTGDNGTTRLVDGSCVEKFNPRVEAYGTIDELNSVLGVVQTLLTETYAEKLGSLSPRLEKIQNHLFNVGSLLATEKKEAFLKMPQITEAHIHQLENWIDEATLELPQLSQFILPGGSLVASYIHMGRTFCRRSERRTAEILVQDSQYQNVLIYLNRLSDLLFTWARWTNIKLQINEVTWKKNE